MTGWTPILEGGLAVRAGDAMRDIAGALVGFADPVEHLALYWAYTASALPEHEARFDDAIERLVRRIEAGLPIASLYGGAAGVGWVAAHVAAEAEELLGAIDKVVIDALEVSRWAGDYDLVSGLVGLGVYFLERGEAGLGGLERVLDHLETSAQRTAEGIRWHTAPALLPPHQRATAPAGYFNCGLAHGAAGVVALLARVPDRARGLLGGAARWLAAQRMAPGGSCYFPAMITEERVVKSRTAWCYGDPGVLLALWRANPSRELEDLAASALGRSPAEAVVFDADLCHGAMGLAHIANRFFQATGDERFRELAVGWIDHALTLRIPGEGIAGFRSHHGATPTTPAYWATQPNLIDGAAGIGLALQAALGSTEPAWDRLMLCDLPVRG